ncbi:MAG: NADH peroxidase, partial [Lachnospiraceae bacterium]|nr:NADH peroxidase [Lachnospiraceae bacterium]
MKWVCQVCGYVHEGDEPPAECPVCHAPAAKFKEQSGDVHWDSEHVIGIAKDAPDDIKEQLKSEFMGECSEVGMYLAMSRQAV